MCPPGVETLTPSPMKVLQSSPAALQSQIPWGFLVPLPDPRLGSLMWGSAPSLHWEDCDVTVLQVVGSPSGGWRITLIFTCGTYFAELE